MSGGQDWASGQIDTAGGMIDGPVIVTYTGRTFEPMNPRPEAIDIRDIAHALSNKCRFTGHCRTFYSVAQHSVLVSMLVPDRDALWGLLHDAGEAYLPDVASPIKGRFPQLIAAENLILETVAWRFGLVFPMPREVKAADMSALKLEARCLMPRGGLDWSVLADVPMPRCPFRPCGPRRAKQMFLARFKDLTR
jgi:uncharacterized protein